MLQEVSYMCIESSVAEEVHIWRKLLENPGPWLDSVQRFAALYSLTSLDPKKRCLSYQDLAESFRGYMLWKHKL